MGIFMFSILLIFAFLGLYYLGREIFYRITLKGISIDDNIQLVIYTKNAENSIEIFVRKFLEKYYDYSILKKIKIVDLNSEDNTYDILKMLKKEYGYIEIEKICFKEHI